MQIIILFFGKTVYIDNVYIGEIKDMNMTTVEIYISFHILN